MSEPGIAPTKHFANPERRPVPGNVWLLLNDFADLFCDFGCKVFSTLS
jgi:hypothetical protein